MDYKTAGVDISKGDAASRAAYTNAKSTFASRNGLIGQPVQQDGGFSGALDMGDFYLIQNDDGTGTKIELAEKLGKYDTIGQDLASTVADDAICVGAEVISITNTIDTPHVDPQAIETMTQGLANTCQQQRIVIPGGEIAELSDALNSMVWNATAVGVVKKDKFITGATIAPGQAIIGLKDPMLRSNGFTLARRICQKAFGDNWHTKEWKDGTSWGEILLTPSKIFHRLLLDTVLGDFQSPRPFTIHGIAHITGGGIPGNLPRIFPNKELGAKLNNLHTPHPAVTDLLHLGSVDESEAYRTWHCGTAMMLITDQSDAQNICNALNTADNEVDAKVVGEITNTSSTELISGFSGNPLTF